MESFEWGPENWGEAAAAVWLDKFQSSIEERLSKFPEAYGAAPESREFNLEIRQMPYGRYRALFVIPEQEVLVLRISGPFFGDLL